MREASVRATRISRFYSSTLIRQNKLDAAMPEIEDAITAFGLDEGMLEAALSVKERLGPRRIDNRQGKKERCPYA